jgi:ribosomal protein S18 acetylase RimI-like enzyme
MKQSGALKIGFLSDSETEAAVLLWEEARLTRPWNDPRADIRRALASPASTVLAGRIDGRLIATAMVGFDGHRGWVYYLAVAASEQGQGLGRQMMRAAETWFGEHGAPKLNLMVRADNSATQNFYKKMSYKVSDVVVLQRELVSVMRANLLVYRRPIWVL